MFIEEKASESKIGLDAFFWACNLKSLASTLRIAVVTICYFSIMNYGK